MKVGVSVAITLAVAESNLDLWVQASAALATSASYRIGSRELTRADAKEVREMITYWQNMVEQLQNSTRGSGRVIRVVPRDL